MNQINKTEAWQGHPASRMTLPGGPLFEAGPGWGAKTKAWVNKYLWPIVVPLVAILGLWLGAQL